MSTQAASHEELVKNSVPLEYRDSCSALLIDLNKCRHKNNYLNWKCGAEKHHYEQCQFEDYIRRVQKLKQKKLEEAEA